MTVFTCSAPSPCVSGTVDGQASSKGYGLDAVGRVLSESGGAPATPATPTVDQNITATDVTDGSGTISTDTFNTTHPNETLVALVAAGGGTSTQTVSVTGAGLSWSRVAQANSQRGDAEIWTATTSTALSGASVTASQQVTAVGKMTLQVLSFTGAGSVIGHTDGGSSGAPAVSFDAVAANSLVFGAGFTWKNAETTTASDGQTVLHAVSGDGTFGNTWTQQVDVATTTAGQAVALSDTAPTDETWDLAGVEVTPAADTVAGTLTVDQNVFSADVGDGSGTATSPAISTSQPGELLVALVSAGGFATTQTVTVSGGGLTWTRLQQANSQRGDAEIWTATATTTLSGVTVQAVQAQPVGKISLEVVSLIGAQTAVGYSAGAASGAATVSFNALSGNSLVFGAGFDWQTAATTTAGAGQSITHQISITGTNGNTWMQQLDAPVAAGDGVTINDTAPTSEAWNLAAVEVVPTQVSAATTNHYDNTGDAPAWITTPGGGWTRNIAGLDGGLDAIVSYDPTQGATSTSLQLLDLHADVAGVADPAGTGLAATYTYDEFGNPTTTNTARYGWLGGKTRAQAGIGNLTLMGARVYNPATGRFLQTDPIPGGSANPYDYACQDPINRLDLAGSMPIWEEQRNGAIAMHYRVLNTDQYEEEDGDLYGECPLPPKADDWGRQARIVEVWFSVDERWSNRGKLPTGWWGGMLNIGGSASTSVGASYWSGARTPTFFVEMPRDGSNVWFSANISYKGRQYSKSLFEIDGRGLPGILGEIKSWF